MQSLQQESTIVINRNNMPAAHSTLMPVHSAQNSIVLVGALLSADSWISHNLRLLGKMHSCILSGTVKLLLAKHYMTSSGVKTQQCHVILS